MNLPNRQKRSEAVRRFNERKRLGIVVTDSQRRKERIQDYVDVNAETGCWIWTGCLDVHGYGSTRDPVLQKTMLAHRLSWLAYRGEIPGQLNVLHKCDVPACVNPDHLFIGTQADNIEDMTRKGRHWLSTQGLYPLAKLTREDVARIRKESAAGASRKDVACRYGVHYTSISKIVGGKTWK